jgi:hypothetical protein
MKEPIIIENLEVWPDKSYSMNFEWAEHIASEVGKGWRIPTISELAFILYPNREKLLDILINAEDYWSISPGYSRGNYQTFSFDSGNSRNRHETTQLGVMLVRSITPEAALNYLLKDF